MVFNEENVNQTFRIQLLTTAIVFTYIQVISGGKQRFSENTCGED